MSSIMTVILPIAIVLIIVGIVFFISKVGKDFISIKITHWLLIIYVSVLVLSTALIPFVTVDRKERETTKQEEMIKLVMNYLRSFIKGKGIRSMTIIYYNRTVSLTIKIKL